jgi:magnesium-protoporphyrin IX monomethyl ester (oxidative) cyclase
MTNAAASPSNALDPELLRAASGRAPALRAAPNETTRAAQTSATLSPRFYTTDFDAMDRMSVEPVRAEWDGLIAELAADKNRRHFVRDRTDLSWDLDVEKIPAPLKKEFVDFLVSSLTSEFSGCILYAEIKKRGKNADLCTLFKYMSRDESRHAGFINDSLKDFGVQVDMGFLVKSKKYTFFSPKFILMATYLSEKIGYARYIKIYRHLEQHPEKRFHPIFKWFREWCNDEFRHGEALALLMRADPKLLSGVNRWWIRFFQLTVFATMFVRDHSRVEFHKALGIDPEAYGMDVFRITLDISKQVFPVLLDIDNPAFLTGLRKLHRCAVGIEQATDRGGIVGHLRALALRLQVVTTLIAMFFLPTVRNTLPTGARLSPTW